MTGKIVILSGPGGAGKDTVLAEWSHVNPNVVRVVAYTTRARRNNEIDKVDYHFVSREKFEQLKTEGYFLEAKEINGNGYATPQHDMESLVAQGKIAVLKIDVFGALDVMKLLPEVESIFLAPPSIEALRERMQRRAEITGESTESIEQRIKLAEKEMSHASAYRHIVINHEVEKAVQEIQAIING